MTEPKRSIEDIHVKVVGDMLKLSPLSDFMKTCIRRWLEEENGHIVRTVDRAAKVLKLRSR